MKIVKYLLVSLVLLGFTAQAVWAFSFSEYEKAEQNNISKPLKISDVITTVNCLNGEKIAVMVGETESRGRWAVSANGDFGPLIIEFNRQLNKLGLKTYSPVEINNQIAREEQDAFLANDLDAAASAATRLSAMYFLKGVISIHSQVNRIVGIDELFLTINLNLIDAHGRDLAYTQLSEAVFSDSDITSTALKLVKEKSLQALAVLFKDFCNSKSEINR